MKTQIEIDALKKNWLSDPCWDIEETEGFEEHKAELKEFRLTYEAEWRAKNRLFHRAESLGINDLGPKDNEPDLRLMTYLEWLETRIRSLEDRLHAVETISDLEREKKSSRKRSGK